MHWMFGSEQSQFFTEAMPVPTGVAIVGVLLAAGYVFWLVIPGLDDQRMFGDPGMKRAIGILGVVGLCR